MTARITVGFDGTPTSTEAARWAAYEAVARGLPLRVLSCLEMPMFVDPLYGGPTASACVALQEAVEADVARLLGALVDEYPTLVVTGASSVEPPVAALTHDLGGDDLLVVGAGRHDRLSTIVIGSTTRRVLHESPCPVVVVHGAASRGRPDRVVVGVDGTVASDEALRWAVDEADRHAVGLVVVHAWSRHGSADPTADRSRELGEIDAACTLGRSVAAARERGVADVTGVLVERATAPALLDAVTDGDLLVLGSRGRGSLRARLFGSTVDLVLERCAVPVVVMRAHGEGRPASSAAPHAEHTSDGHGRPVDLVPVR